MSILLYILRSSWFCGLIVVSGFLGFIFSLLSIRVLRWATNKIHEKEKIEIERKKNELDSKNAETIKPTQKIQGKGVVKLSKDTSELTFSLDDVTVTVDKIKSADIPPYSDLGIMTGVVERFFFTLLIGLFGPSAVASAAIAWIGIKGQVHYKMFTDKNPDHLPRIYVALLGSMISLIFAFAGGAIWCAGPTW